MAGMFRIGIRWKGPAGRRRSSVDDIRWSLAALDPSLGLRCGRFAASDGAGIPYRLWEAETKTRAILLLLHGAFDYSGAFDEIGPLLSKKGFTSVAYDQRGFGGTVSRGRWCGKRRMVSDVCDMTRMARARYGEELPLFIIGESMGAAVAVQAAARYPQLEIDGMVLAAPGALSGLFRRTIVAWLLRAAQWFAPQGALVCERMSGWELTPGAAIRLLVDPLILRMVRPAMLFGLANLAHGAIDEAHAVHVPTLTMAGSKDAFIRIDCMKHLHCRLAGAKEWAFFEGGPHLLLHWRYRDQVLDHAIGWIEQRISARACAGARDGTRAPPAPAIEGAALALA